MIQKKHRSKPKQSRRRYTDEFKDEAAHITHGSAGFHTVQTSDHDSPSQPIRTGTERLTFGRKDRDDEAAEFLSSANGK